MSSKTLLRLLVRPRVPPYPISRTLHATVPQLQAPPSSPVASPSASEAAEDEDKSDTISKAMQSYIQRAKEYQEFIDKAEKEFVFGRRHLANMMGKDPEHFTQPDIDEAIRYLFPCALFDTRARPMMKPPQQVYPKQKAAQFDISGRPHHPFFYTATPNFYYIMHEMVAKLNKMNADAGGLQMDNSDFLPLAGTTWITKEEFEGRLMEKLSDKQYAEWVSCMERIATHPEKQKQMEFIKGYRKALSKQTTSDEFPPVTLEPDGSKSCYVPVCMKRTARGEVKVRMPGTGKFFINGESLDYFKSVRAREIVLTPLQLIGWLGKVDVDAYVTGACEPHQVNNGNFPGEASQANCIRWGIATAMAALGADVERLRLAGLLIRDRRVKERNRIAHTGARAAWTWKKR